MTDLSQNYKKKYAEDGFVVLKKEVPSKVIDKLYETYVHLLAKFNLDISDERIQKLLTSDPWITPEFNQAVINFRKDYPQFFSVLYDTISTSVVLQQVFGRPELMDKICPIIGEDASSLSITGHMLRMDAPFDKRNSLGWHQDSSYYNQNLEGSNGFVLWIPMHDVGPKNGTIKIAPGSMIEGDIKVEKVNQMSLDLSNIKYQTGILISIHKNLYVQKLVMLFCFL